MLCSSNFSVASPARLFFPVAIVAIVAISGLARGYAQTGTFEDRPIDYHKTPVNDPVELLSRKLKSGEVELDFDSKSGYLKSVLALLDIPHNSQALVFSKTSLQLQRISPSRPRAIYFNDEVYVGFCQKGEIIELASTDPQQGTIFYSLKQELSPKPKFDRDRGQCLNCHANGRTQNVPGLLVRSVYPNLAGHPLLGNGTSTTDHTFPLSQRFGGWYVTGTHGTMTHIGNRVFKDESDKEVDEGNLLKLDDLIDTKPYLTSHSDIVALMVLEHQTQTQNAITAANFETREALHQSYEMNELLQREKGTISDVARRRISAVADQLLERLLFCKEYALTSPIEGTSDFAETFSAKGKRDSKGRSLRDLDLQTRMFKYPCSYLIYAPAFDGLPKEVKDLTAKRLVEILEGKNQGEKYSHLSDSDRNSIFEILKETKPELFLASE